MKDRQNRIIHVLSQFLNFSLELGYFDYLFLDMNILINIFCIKLLNVTCRSFFLNIMFDRFFDPPPPTFLNTLTSIHLTKKCSQPLNVYQLCIFLNFCLYRFHISVVLICQ